MAVRKATAQERREVVAEALGTLPVQQRAIVTLRFGIGGYDEMPPHKIARRWKISTRQVNSQLTRALKKFAAREDLRDLVGLE